MRIRKLVALGLSVVMVAGLTACGGEKSEPSNGGDDSVAATQGTEASQEVKTDDDENKTITFWNIGTENPDASIMKYAVDQFNSNTDSGYQVELTAIQNDKYKEKLVIAMSSQECPDMYTSWTGGPLQEYINSGYAQPITDLYKEAGLDKIYMDAGTAQSTYNNDIYAVPILNVAISGIFYNKEIFEQYNLQEPKTISELEKICDTLKENNIIPFALANSTKWQGSMYYQGLATRYAGLEDLRNAFGGTGSFEADCFKYAGEKITDWVKKGYFPEGVNSLSTDDGQDKQLLYQEKACMFYSGSWYTGTISSDSKEFYEKLGWFPFPECDEVDNASDFANICNGTIGDQFISFNCQGDKLKAAFDCVTNYSTDDAIQLMVDSGKIPPVKGVEDKLKDPLLLKVCNFAEGASDVQLWYDQYLPSTVANAHLDSCQELFALTMTPEKACEETQKAMEEYLADKK